LYVFHLAALTLGSRHILPLMPWAYEGPATRFYWTFGMTLCLSIVAAELSHRLFEGPFLRLKEKRAAVPTRVA
jgi:peptidoglycan/LPS O-acetylase OafA/YrhL